MAAETFLARHREASIQPASPLLMTPRDAARLLSISERTLWSLTRQGKLPCVRIGRAVRYDAADLRVFIDCQKEGRA